MKKTTLTPFQVNYIKKVARLTIKKNGVLPILDSFLIQNGELMATDLQNFVTIKGLNLNKDLQFCIDGKSLLNVIDNMSTFSISQGRSIEFCSYSEKMIFEYEEAGEFPKTPVENSEIQGFITKEDVDHIAEAVKFTGHDELRPALTCIALKDGYIAATDAHLLYFKKSGIQPKKPVLLSKSTCHLISLFGYIEPLRLSVGTAYITIENSIVKIVSRSVDENYPDFQKVIPTETTTSIVVSKDELHDTIRKALLVADPITKLVKFKANGTLQITAKNSNHGRAYKRTVDLAKIDGYEIEIGFNGKFFDKALSTTNSYAATIELGSPTRAAILNKNILVMPVTINEES